MSEAGLPSTAGDAAPMHPTAKWQLWAFAGGALAVLGGYLAYIAIFGVNAVYWDEFAWVPLVRASQTGTLSLSALWAQHNENRVLFPNLVAIVLARASHWNDFYFFGFSALLLTFAVGFVLWVYRRELRHSPMWFVAVPLLGYTLVQYENTLWAYQVAWYLVLFALVGSIAILVEKRDLRVRWFVVAVILGVIASYSSVQGLLVWPAGLVVLLSRGRKGKDRLIWSAAGVAAVTGYFIGYSNASAGIHHSLLDYLRATPSISGAYFLTIGNVIPNFHVAITVGPLKFAFGGTIRTSELIGAIVTFWGMALILRWILRGRPGGVDAFAVALIVTGLLFDLLLIPTRLYGNEFAGLASRYTTINLLLYLGIYLATLFSVRQRALSRPWSIVISALAVLLVVTQAYSATTNGISNGEQEYALRTTSADILANSSEAPASLIEPYLFPPLTGVYSNIAVLKKEEMNVFSGDEAARFRALGILPCCVSAQLVTPSRVLTWFAADNRARIAWRTLSAVAIDLMSTSQQSAFQAGRSTLSEVDNIIASAAHTYVPTSELSPWYPPPSLVFLEAESVYYKAWSAELTWHDWRVVAPPQQIRHFVYEHPLASLAWNELLGTLANTPALNARFSLLDPARLLKWASMTGSTSNGVAVLIPLHAQLVVLASLDT